MRTLLAAIVAAAFLVVPLGLAGTASAAGTARDLTPVVIGPMTTDRFGGGDFVAVKAGDALFGVRYGTSAHPNDVVIFAEYKRFLGGADIVDAQGNHLATRGIPVETVLGQRLTHFIEFRPLNLSQAFDLTSIDHSGLPLTWNLPMKATSLTTAWQLTDLTNESANGITFVNFTVSAQDLPYVHIANGTNVGDGKLNLVAFTFHLKVGVEDRSARVPWFRITVSQTNRYEFERVEFLGYRNVSGPTVAMGAKYDHRIEGWDFSYPEDRLALVTQLIFGNYVPERTAAFVHAILDERADNDAGHPLGDAQTLNQTQMPRPELYTRDRVYFDDDYTRIGRFQWETSVTVDGVPSTMTFNLQGGHAGIQMTRNGAFFVGFWLRGAFVYPAGQVIVHDPVMSADALLDLPIGVNLTPMTILVAQMAVVAMAVGPALYLRAKARRQR